MFIYYICINKQQQTSIMSHTTHKGLRLRLRWQIAQRRRQRRRKERRTQAWSAVPIYLPPPVPVHHSTLSVLCQYDECAELKEYRARLARQGFRLDIEKLTTAPANCSKCLIRQSLAELRALELRPKQPVK